MLHGDHDVGAVELGGDVAWAEEGYLGLTTQHRCQLARLADQFVCPLGDMTGGVLAEHHPLAARVVPHPFTKPRARSRPTRWSAVPPAPPVSISACPLSSGPCILRTTRPLLAPAGD